MDKTTALIVVATVLGVFLVYGVSHSIGGERPTSDVFLVMTEATRADHIGPCYGYNRTTAPNICSLAEDGVLFEKAHSQGTLTPVAVPPILTALPPGGAGAEMMGRGYAKGLSTSYTTFPEVLADEGYGLRAASDSSPHSSWIASVNFLQGFDTSFVDLPSALPTDSPVFVWWFMRDLVHVPFSPPAEYRLWGNISENRLGGGYGAYSTQEMINLYDAEVLEADEGVGELVNRLKREGRYEDAFIIFTSDHGEFFGEHGLKGHAGPPYDEVISVPLVIKLPGNAFAGERVGQPVRHIDIAPTLYEYFGIERNEPFGTSLIPAVEGTPLNLTTYAAGSGGSWSIRNSNYTYLVKGTDNPCNITESAVEELYVEGKEGENILPDKPSVSRQLRQERCSVYRDAKEYAKEPVLVERNREVKERLRELGYLE